MYNDAGVLWGDIMKDFEEGRIFFFSHATTKEIQGHLASGESGVYEPAFTPTTTHHNPPQPFTTLLLTTFTPSSFPQSYHPFTFPSIIILPTLLFQSVKILSPHLQQINRTRTVKWPSHHQYSSSKAENWKPEPIEPVGIFWYQWNIWKMKRWENGAIKRGKHYTREALPVRQVSKRGSGVVGRPPLRRAGRNKTKSV